VVQFRGLPLKLLVN